MKQMFLAMFAATALVGAGTVLASAASPDQVESCLERYGSFVPRQEVSTMSAVCRPLVSAPQSRFPYGHWPMDSEEVAAFATECGSRYGTVIPVRKQAAVEEACRLFYYPVYGKSELSLRVPVRQMETVASY